MPVNSKKSQVKSGSKTAKKDAVEVEVKVEKAPKVQVAGGKKKKLSKKTEKKKAAPKKEKVEEQPQKVDIKLPQLKKVSKPKKVELPKLKKVN